MDEYLVLRSAARPSGPAAASPSSAAPPAHGARTGACSHQRVGAVEIDGLTSIGGAGSACRPQPAHLHGRRAASLARQPDGRYDAIFVDAYRQPYIPHLATRGVLRLVRASSRPAGWSS
jgi:hypothetical protein